MKMVVLDGYTLNPGDLSWEGLKKFGDLKVYDRTTLNPQDKELIIERIGNAGFVFTNKTPITREIIEASTNLKYIGVLATGFNIVDIQAAKEKGIIVSNVPGYGTNAVAQTAIALLLELCHRIGDHDRAVKEGQWTNCPDYSFSNYPLIELADKTMGIIGLGRIGKATARIAQGLGMRVLAYDEYQDVSIVTESLQYTDLERLLRESDVIVLHCALTSSSKGIINKNNIAKMKDGVMLVNNSRGGLIVEEDLVEALESGKIYGAAVDVVSKEPILESNPLLKAKNCIITPHLSGAAIESRIRLMNIAINNLSAYLNGNPTNVVNN
ncbi:D-2-hydroxyacid dehydrogenase [Alkaliphilus pronyensis]|uniref:D-2-hydroxyacid dehydrogenase n=1 Tax=Alkaliphilus pronyensis TaxID=1482732 RepID=A0A6I0F7T1_9FIRM|nr:D-2-hydroxyacid dehydrogenase [Alkaliphilus pronyensis]KAB3534426.1 D-2-hydroxyacid dehydrogenase [Alkaliphilus pronyensis]